MVQIDDTHVAIALEHNLLIASIHSGIIEESSRRLNDKILDILHLTDGKVLVCTINKESEVKLSIEDLEKHIILPTGASGYSPRRTCVQLVDGGFAVAVEGRLIIYHADMTIAHEWALGYLKHELLPLSNGSLIVSCAKDRTAQSKSEARILLLVNPQSKTSKWSIILRQKTVYEAARCPTITQLSDRSLVIGLGSTNRETIFHLQNHAAKPIKIHNAKRLTILGTSQDGKLIVCEDYGDLGRKRMLTLSFDPMASVRQAVARLEGTPPFKTLKEKPKETHGLMQDQTVWLGGDLVDEATALKQGIDEADTQSICV